MSLNPVGDKSSIVYSFIRILIQQIRQTKQYSISRSQVLEHHERVYFLTRLIMPQMDKFFSCLKCLSASCNA
jgi:hypothetical protein